jgi:ABC-type multidrug transport system fused ATPase/permease subunit
VASLAEMVNVGLVVPFLVAISDPESLFNYPSVGSIAELIGLDNANQILLAITVLFGVAIALAGGVRLLLLWSTTKLSNAIGAELSIEIYRRTLFQSYAAHVARNSSEVISAIMAKTNHVIAIIMHVLALIGAAVMLVAIVAALLVVDTVIALVAIGGFGFIYALIIRLTKSRLRRNSQCSARKATRVVKVLQEGLGGIRDIILDGNQNAYCQAYQAADLPLRQAQASTAFISASPRFVAEAFGMLLIVCIAYVMTRNGGFGGAIPMLGALALSAQRALPGLQQVYGAIAGIRGSQQSLQDALALLEQSMPQWANEPLPEALPFECSIRLENIRFSYGNDKPWVLSDISLELVKGGRIGIIGPTGCGKSTLMDVVMGLLEPTGGRMLVDNRPIEAESQRAWQRRVAHVPQAIFLTDASIEENIAFGVPLGQIERDRVARAARQAHIADVIESWPDGYRTQVGERGVRLSGGQRQRIGIARALYKSADVIIFDEATSALDSQTEQAVMEAIGSLSDDLTVIIIAHRTSTLRDCAQIVELDQGRIKRVGSYREIIQSHADA